MGGITAYSGIATTLGVAVRDDIAVGSPALSEAGAMIRFRREMFVMELVDAGCSREDALHHTAGWISEGGIDEYRATLAKWLVNPSVYVRVVRSERVKGGIAGLFVADIGRLNYVRSIQLHPDIRREGVGLHLMIGYFQTVSRLSTSDVVALEVFEGNFVARAFYARLGFSQVRRDALRIGAAAGAEGSLMARLRLQRNIR